MHAYSFCFQLAAHEGRTRTEVCEVPIPARAADTAPPSGVAFADFQGAHWRLELKVEKKSPGIFRSRFTATVESGSAEGIAAGLRIDLHPWSSRDYVLLPGAVYAGNRFAAARRPYSPTIRNLGQKADKLELDVGDIPRLALEPGHSHIDQTSLDCAIPGMGVRFTDTDDALLILTPQTSSVGPIGLEMIEAEMRDRASIQLLAPGFIHPIPGDDDPMSGIGNLATAHLHPQNAVPVSLKAGQSIEFAFEWHTFGCPDVHTLFERFFAHRTTLFPEAANPLPKVLPLSAAWDILKAKHNAQNWDEALGLYRVGIAWLDGQATQYWQNGWIGGGITTLPMLQEGDKTDVARARRNLDFLFSKALSPIGLFKATMSESGEWESDAFKSGGLRGTPLDKAVSSDTPVSLVRRQGDVLYFAVRQLLLLQEREQAIPEAWLEANRRSADALCRVWATEGEFGFLLNYETGEVTVGGSTSGAIIPAALALASTVFDEARYLDTALAAAEHYRMHDLAWGVTTGGPGDALQAPDGESIFGLIESFILLHELTGDEKWCEAAQHACYQAASWVIAYPYAFPDGSALQQIGCDARGAMIANAQNKCGVPGICTLSGQGILRTFRATGDVRLLDCLRDIAHALPQFVSRKDRPIPTRITWAHPYKELPEGWVCERVNITPSWAEPLGEQAAYSCWCEVALMLTWCDLPGIYAQPDTGLIRCLDHVKATWTDGSHSALRIENPTAYPARVRVQIETRSEARTQTLTPNYTASLPQVALNPNSAGFYALP